MKKLTEKTYRENVNIEHNKVKSHGEGDGRDEPDVRPWRHGKERLVFRQAVGIVQRNV